MKSIGNQNHEKGQKFEAPLKAELRLVFSLPNFDQTKSF